MDRINHVKIVTPEPEAVDRFLREVLEIPDGWTIPGAKRAQAHPPAKASPVTWESVIARRGDDGSGGFITGSPESRQLQILRGAKPHIWSIAVGTRHIERATSAASSAASRAPTSSSSIGTNATACARSSPRSAESCSK